MYMLYTVSYGTVAAGVMPVLARAAPILPLPTHTAPPEHRALLGRRLTLPHAPHEVSKA